MATLHSFFSSFMRFLLYSSLLFVLLSCFLEKSHALGGRNANTEGHFHTLQISSLLPASVCSPSTGSSEKQSTLEVFHRHGPCSKLGQDKAATTPSLSEVLSYDQSRVESIRAGLTRNQINDKKVNLPAQSGISLGTGNYLVTVGLGTPMKTLSLVFDTGSDLTWTQCQPCDGSCYRQQDPIFDPSSSSSYSNISCSSSECSQLSSATGIDPRCITGTCVYGAEYGDKSFSEGFFSKDKLTITANDVFPDFLFGCGQNNKLIGRSAGLIGLGPDPLSLVSQTAQTYGKYFSYCLPSVSSSTGHLTLGQGGVSSSVKFTPFATSQGTPLYFIDIISISVGGRQLSISQSVFQTPGTIIDSGTVITRLPPSAYTALSTEFQQQMQKYPTAPPNSLFDTCYDFANYNTNITIPAIAFTFSDNVKVDLDPSGIIVPVSATQACLAFIGNSGSNDVGIFGNTQQKTLEVVYDVAEGKLGFGAGGCN